MREIDRALLLRLFRHFVAHIIVGQIQLAQKAEEDVAGGTCPTSVFDKNEEIRPAQCTS